MAFEMKLKYLLFLICFVAAIFSRGNHASDTDPDDEEAMELCNKKCKCEDGDKKIMCKSMRELWSLVTEGGKFSKEFADYEVVVSDKNLKHIDHTFRLKKEQKNGLIEIRGLVLSNFKVLKTINESFFEDHFPNLEYLTITETENELQEITIGKLPHLKVLQLNGHKLRTIRGCGERTRFCFDENKMELLEVPSLNLKHLGLPQYITTVKIDLNHASTEIGDENVFKTKIIETLDFTMPKAMTFPVPFTHIESVEEFIFEIPHMKDEQLWSLIASVHDTPFLAYRMNLKMKTKEEETEVKFPVIMKPCSNCDYDEIAHIADLGGVCFDEQQYLDTFNADLPKGTQKNRTLTIRGIFVDIDKLLQELDGDATFHVTIYTIIAKVPKTKFINFDLKVYYAVLQNEGVFSQSVTVRKPYTMIRMEDMFGAPLRFAKSLDGIFVHQYSLCIAKLAAIRHTTTGSVKDSIAWNMFENLPTTAIHTPCSEPLINSKTSTIQNLLHRYMYMYANEEKKINRLPAMPIYMQEELAGILVEAAANIEEKRADFAMRPTFNDFHTTVLYHVNNVINHEDGKQVKFLKYEQSKALKLASLVLRKRDMYEKRLKQIRAALNEQISNSVEMGNELETKARAFISGALSREAQEWATIGSDVSYSLVSVITVGGFDFAAVEQKAVEGGSMMVKLKNITSVLHKLQQLMETMKEISVLYGEVKDIFKERYEILKRNLKRIDARMSPKQKTTHGGLLKRISKGLRNVEDIGEGVLALARARGYRLEYDSGTEMLATAELKLIEMEHELQLHQVEKWDTVHDKIEALFDKDVTLKIPETEEFKATLFNMITKSKTITQLRFAEARITSELIAADKNYWAHIEEYSALGNAVDEIKVSGMLLNIGHDVKKAEEEYKLHFKKSQKYIFYVTFINKLRILETYHDFCQGYFYYHLKPCPIQNYIDIFIPIGEVKKRFDDLMFGSTIKKFQNFNPPPQSFDNIAVVIKKEPNCKCVMEPYERLKDVETDRNVTETEEKKFMELSKLTCYPHEKNIITDKVIMAKLDRCNVGQLENFINQKTISVQIPLNYKDDFIMSERVRVDDVRVFINGIKTSNGKVVVKIVSPGIIQDRYEGDVYKFYGSQWARSYEYCGKDIKHTDSSKDYDPYEQTRACASESYKTILSTNIHPDFRGFHLKPSLFSTWIVSVPPELNPGLDLQSVESLEISFSGSLIPGGTDYGKYSLDGRPPKELSEEDDDDNDAGSFGGLDDPYEEIKNEEEKKITID